MYSLSLLDKSPIMPGESAGLALSNTIDLARRADALGYHRFWVAEHHGSNELACSAPEILISWVLANTSRIRVGSGGVMLQHYSPYKVAEVFNLISTLAPDRVDLGVGKTPGGLPRTTAALQAYRAAKPDFEDQLVSLSALLDDAQAPAPDGNLAFAAPRPPAVARRFLLGASPESASLAARHGWDFVFAGHLNGDSDNMRKSLETYRAERKDGSVILALAAFASETESEAAALISELKVFKVILENGASQLVGSLDRAEEFAKQSGIREYRIEERRPTALHGTARDVHRELSRMADAFGIEEFIIDTPAVGHAHRLKSIELLAPADLPLTD